MIGKLALLKDLREGFNREMIEIIRTFVSQASISIENFRLVEEAIENERYKEELKIAKSRPGKFIAYHSWIETRISKSQLIPVLPPK